MELGRPPEWPNQLAAAAEDLHVLAEEVSLIRQAIEKIAMVMESVARDGR